MMSDKKILSAADILDMDDTVYEDVDVPEWHGVVRLRSLNAAEMAEFVDMNTAAVKSKDAPVRLLMLCAINEDGSPMFPRGDDGKTNATLAKLKLKNMRAFMRVQKRALVINGLVEEVADVKND